MSSFTANYKGYHPIDFKPVEQRFRLRPGTVELVRSMTPEFGFNGLGEVVFRRTYSRGGETWADVVVRVTEGIFSIRKDHFVNNRLAWDDADHLDFAHDMAVAMFNMEWLPPGRGLWMCGTDFCYNNGSMSLTNCAATTTEGDFVLAAEWTMDLLMTGVGVGFDVKWRGRASQPVKAAPECWTIPDSRQGWVESLVRLLCAYID